MRILAINVEIGHGHPNYLDYVLQGIKQIEPKAEIEYWDVLTREKGFTRLFWQISKKIYSFGAKGGMITEIYNRLRSNSKMPNLTVCTIAKHGFDRILVSHPLLARYLGCVWYIHGEVALPKECVLNNVEKIVVPTEYTVKRLIIKGIKSEQVFQSGLLIADDLVVNAKENIKKRRSRIKSSKPLTIGFFISGAYPAPHIEKMLGCINSVQEDNHRVIVFLGTDRKKANKFINQLNRRYADVNKPKASILFMQGKTRIDYQKRVNRLLPLLDIMVAPSHEYTNWAIGLGLPMFTLFPMIGSYAQENFNFLTNQGVTHPIKTNLDAKNLANILAELRNSGALVKMVENGSNKFPIDGAIKTAQAIVK